MIQIASWIVGALSRERRLVKLKSRQVQRDEAEFEVARARLVSSLRERLASPSSLLACVITGYILAPRRKNDSAPRRHTSRRNSLLIAAALPLRRLAAAYTARERRRVTEVPDAPV